MAKSSNTWCKKLMHKGKVYALKQKLGNEVGVMNYCQKARPVTARALTRESIEDKPLPTPPKPQEKSALPRIEGWKPRSFGKRGK